MNWHHADPRTANDLRDLSLNGDPTTDSRLLGTAAICVALTGALCAIAPVIGWLLAGVRYP